MGDEAFPRSGGACTLPRIHRSPPRRAPVPSVAPLVNGFLASCRVHTTSPPDIADRWAVSACRQSLLDSEAPCRSQRRYPSAGKPQLPANTRPERPCRPSLVPVQSTEQRPWLRSCRRSVPVAPKRRLQRHGPRIAQRRGVAPEHEYRWAPPHRSAPRAPVQGNTAGAPFVYGVRACGVGRALRPQIH